MSVQALPRADTRSPKVHTNGRASSLRDFILQECGRASRLVSDLTIHERDCRECSDDCSGYVRDILSELVEVVGSLRISTRSRQEGCELYLED